MHQALTEFLANLGIIVSNDALIILISLFSVSIGIAIALLISQRKINKIKNDFNEQQRQERAFFDDQLDQIGHTFSSLSQQALKDNSESFLTLAQQRFSQLQSNASNELKSREQSFANLLQPIKQSIEHTDQQLKKLDQDRKVTETKLGEQISQLLTSQHGLQAETRNLVTALRRPEVRGQWGELTLKRVVELAGMSEYCDFDQQITVQTESGVLRPDMLIRLPSERLLVVDVKTPLDAYINALENNDLTKKQAFLKQHCDNVKQRIKELSLKQYWQQFDRSPDFVILFIPGDQFLSAALDEDKTLLETALKQQILLATPTSLVGLLRAIAYGWNQDTLSKNSEVIKTLGESIYQRLLTLTEHLNKLGKHLDQSTEQFNRLVGSYQSNTLPAAKKLSELGVGGQQQTDAKQTTGTPTRRIQTDADEK